MTSVERHVTFPTAMTHPRNHHITLVPLCVSAQPDSAGLIQQFGLHQQQQQRQRQRHGMWRSNRPSQAPAEWENNTGYCEAPRNVKCKAVSAGPERNNGITVMRGKLKYILRQDNESIEYEIFDLLSLFKFNIPMTSALPPCVSRAEDKPCVKTNKQEKRVLFILYLFPSTRISFKDDLPPSCYTVP